MLLKNLAPHGNSLKQWTTAETHKSKTTDHSYGNMQSSHPAQYSIANLFHNDCTVLLLHVLVEMFLRCSCSNNGSNYADMWYLYAARLHLLVCASSLKPFKSKDCMLSLQHISSTQVKFTDYNSAIGNKACTQGHHQVSSSSYIVPHLHFCSFKMTTIFCNTFQSRIQCITILRNFICTVLSVQQIVV